MTALVFTSLLILASGLFTSISLMTGFHLLMVPAIIFYSRKYQWAKFPRSGWFLLAFVLVLVLSVITNQHLIANPIKNIFKSKYYLIGALSIIPLDYYFNQFLSPEKRIKHLRILLIVLLTTSSAATLIGLLSYFTHFNPLGMSSTVRSRNGGVFGMSLTYAHSIAWLSVFLIGLCFQSEKIKNIIITVDPSQKLRTKAIHVLITNACNLSCGGCNQLIGHISKEKTFHVPLATVRAHIETSIRVAELDWNQPWFPPMHRNLSIYGGEPTVHPDWPEILQMLYDEFPDWPFVVLTNGRTFTGKELPQSGDERFAYIKRRKDIKAHHKNVFWRISPKLAGERFLPTLVAPIDIIKDPDLSLYYRMAQDNCPHYERCETLIYKEKGYFCVNAGPMDWLFHDGANGWDIDNADHPFDRTNEEIEAQARLFCHRCYYCLGREPVAKEIVDNPLVQLINMKSFVSETNVNHIEPGTGTLVVFDGETNHPHVK